jgi:two-component system sensor histidine kinase CreC
VSKRNRIFLGILLIYALGVALLLYRVMTDLDPRYRESAEELLVDTANLLASLIESDIRDGVLQPERRRHAFQDMYARRFTAQIYAVTKTRADLRVYVTDRNGTVVFDSLGRDEGKDFRNWRDVRLTLEGGYGARTTAESDGEPRTAVMYVAAPIRWNDEITGVVSVGKPMQGFGGFIASARQKLLLVGLTSGVSVILVSVLVSVWLARPFSPITEYIRYVRDQKQVSLPRLSRQALGIIGAATMRCATRSPGGRTSRSTSRRSRTRSRVRSLPSGARPSCSRNRCPRHGESSFSRISTMNPSASRTLWTACWSCPPSRSGEG